MSPFPLPLTELLGQYGAYAVYLLIGFSFGYVLEIAGFGNSRKLAAQFYFKDLTVLKVMFTAIIVAMILIFGATALGLLDYNLIWVNPTYLWPGIVGGLIMGIGFIVGGFCPGTSLVAVTTLKIDGIFFALGVLTGIFLFGETVQSFEIFWNSSYMGRLTLMDWLGIDTGWVVLGVTLMALFMFWGGEKLEKIYGETDPKKAPKLRYAGAAALLITAIAVLGYGQPTNAQKWDMLSVDKQALLDNREVQIHPGELLDSIHDTKLNIIMLDVRPEADYNLFHIQDANHVPLDELLEYSKDLQLEAANTVFVVMSNHEDLATQGWKILVAENLPNVYILEGGINYWLDIYTDKNTQSVTLELHTGEDQLHHEFSSALGEFQPAAYPDPQDFELEFIPKVKLELKRGPTSGGCG